MFSQMYIKLKLQAKLRFKGRCLAFISSRQVSFFYINVDQFFNSFHTGRYIKFNPLTFCIFPYLLFWHFNVVYPNHLLASIPALIPSPELYGCYLLKQGRGCTYRQHQTLLADTAKHYLQLQLTAVQLVYNPFSQFISMAELYSQLQVNL